MVGLINKMMPGRVRELWMEDVVVGLSYKVMPAGEEICGWKTFSSGQTNLLI